MIDFYKLKVWLMWPQVRVHLCTLAIAFSLNSTWRIPRDGFRFGGVAYGLVFTMAMLLVALPAVILQLAVGQLSQQDAVGVWRAVPFFKGIGYIRLLINYVGALCAIIYLAVSATIFMFTLNNSIPFSDCVDLVDNGGQQLEVIQNATLCFNQTFFAPISEKPEYYIALVLVIVFLWILFPFLLYNPVKYMKRIFYILGPVLPLLWIIIACCIGDKARLAYLSKQGDWANFLRPEIWNIAISRALLTAQIAGGYLISSGDSIYANSDVEWTPISFVGTNIVTVWLALIVWFALGSKENDSSAFAVIAQTYNITVVENLRAVWPLLIFATLFLSGIISMISLLYPIYDRLRRIGGYRWRYISICSSLVGSGMTAGILIDNSMLTMMEDTVLPFLVNFATIIEILAFVFIYGWKVLLEDVEFLAGRELMKFWVWGWWAAPGIIVPFLIWWYIDRFFDDPMWSQPPWDSYSLVVATSIFALIFIIFAIFSVARQVQYDIVGKLKSSFRPSRHWGPRDPIAHYYWLARREQLDYQGPRSRYRRRQLGQFSGTSSILTISKIQELSSGESAEVKRRSNSDDWLYSYRKDYLSEMFDIHYPNKRRSKSLDWAVSHIMPNEGYKKHKNTISCDTTPSDSYVTVENVPANT
ncbi:sodium- and chloride-dependent glycine transporter 1-like [Zerene cesonia]|uniref:sodium- and chloride-dependent glycine transporter 1-like n=1 Tax=Zerene cesonia TaxID=33412 RepID=UPI0018E4F277|nr:sodium- and chloride-dependent glycine transporter 1-like [Zerene cesonia]